MNNDMMLKASFDLVYKRDGMKGKHKIQQQRRISSLLRNGAHTFIRLPFSVKRARKIDIS